MDVKRLFRKFRPYLSIFLWKLKKLNPKWKFCISLCLLVIFYLSYECYFCWLNEHWRDGLSFEREFEYNQRTLEENLALMEIRQSNLFDSSLVSNTHNYPLMSNSPLGFYPAKHFRDQDAIAKDFKRNLAAQMLGGSEKASLKCSDGLFSPLDINHYAYAAYHDHRGLKDSGNVVNIRVITYCLDDNCSNLYVRHSKTHQELPRLSSWLGCHSSVIPSNLITFDATLLFSDEDISLIHSRREDKYIDICIIPASSGITEIEYWMKDTGAYVDEKSGHICVNMKIKPTYFPISYLPRNIANYEMNTRPKRTETPGAAMCLKGWWDGPKGKGNPQQMFEYLSVYHAHGVRKFVIYCPVEDKLPGENTEEATGLWKSVVDLINLVKSTYSEDELSIEVVCNARPRFTPGGDIDDEFPKSGYKRFPFQAQSITYMDCHFRTSEHLLVLPHVDVDEYLLPSIRNFNDFSHPDSFFSLVQQETNFLKSYLTKKGEEDCTKKKTQVCDLWNDFDSHNFKTEAVEIAPALSKNFRRSDIDFDFRKIITSPEETSVIRPTLKGSFQYLDNLKAKLHKDEVSFNEWVRSLGIDHKVAVYCGANAFHYYAWNVFRKTPQPSAFELPMRSNFLGFFSTWDRAKCIVLTAFVPSSRMHDSMDNGHIMEKEYTSVVMKRALSHHFRELVDRWAVRDRRRFWSDGYVYDWTVDWSKGAVIRMAKNILPLPDSKMCDNTSSKRLSMEANHIRAHAIDKKSKAQLFKEGYCELIKQQKNDVQNISHDKGYTQSEMDKWIIYVNDALWAKDLRMLKEDK